jgi:hypothetical protein
MESRRLTDEEWVACLEEPDCWVSQVKKSQGTLFEPWLF